MPVTFAPPTTNLISLWLQGIPDSAEEWRRSSSGEHGSTTSGISRSSSRGTSSSSSPGSRARASRHSRSTPSTRKASGGTWSRSRRPPDPDLCYRIFVFLDLFRQCLGEEIERDRRGGVLCHGHQATSADQIENSDNHTFFNPKREDILGPSSWIIVEDASDFGGPTTSLCILHPPSGQRVLSAERTPRCLRTRSGVHRPRLLPVWPRAVPWCFVPACRQPVPPHANQHGQTGEIRVNGSSWKWVRISLTISDKGNHLGTFGSVGTCRRTGAGIVPLFWMMNSINSGPCWEMLGEMIPVSARPTDLANVLISPCRLLAAL